MSYYYLPLLLIIISTCAQPNIIRTKESEIIPRCRGRNFDQEKCCTDDKPCDVGEGDCEDNDECKDDLVCGNNNCKQFGDYYHEKDDCCVVNKTNESNKSRPPLKAITGLFSNSQFSKIGVVFPLSQPFPGQRCSGRDNQGRRCCTPEDPCGE